MKVKIRDWFGEREIECDQNPLGHKRMCWACLERCENFSTLKEKVQTEFESKLNELKERFKQYEIIEAGSYICLTCPEKPRECRWCMNHPPFTHLQKPYVKLLVTYEEERR